MASVIVYTHIHINVYGELADRDAILNTIDTRCRVAASEKQLLCRASTERRRKSPRKPIAQLKPYPKANTNELHPTRSQAAAVTKLNKLESLLEFNIKRKYPSPQRGDQAGRPVSVLNVVTAWTIL
ncbi:hypothetical protein MSG28_014300 [Choristoneura fumiferana]|uniref:Uncharacterized protein n=1 Tax=Choristoneura fumiferana TaxID=7141 RepID=A0ACC0JGN4_CHOFU|nr:hypothetical protein MSG28_014300 [Choristoneura fumiferana]